MGKSGQAHCRCATIRRPTGQGSMLVTTATYDMKGSQLALALCQLSHAVASIKDQNNLGAGPAGDPCSLFYRRFISCKSKVAAGRDYLQRMLTPFVTCLVRCHKGSLVGFIAANPAFAVDSKSPNRLGGCLNLTCDCVCGEPAANHGSNTPTQSPGAASNTDHSDPNVGTI